MSDRCARAHEIEAMFDRRLDESVAEQASTHAAGCVACRRLLDQLEKLRASLRESVVPPNAFAMKRLRRQVLDASLEPAPKRRLELRWARLLVPALTLIVAAFGGLWLWSRPASPADVTLVAGPGARYEREVSDAKEVVRLTDGEFDFDVHAHASGKRLLVVVPDGEIEDIGTRFHVVVKEGATSEITVSEGEVEFRRRGVPPLRLIAGMSYRPLGAEPISQSAEPSAVAQTPPTAATSAAQTASASASTPPRAIAPVPSSSTLASRGSRPDAARPLPSAAPAPTAHAPVPLASGSVRPDATSGGPTGITREDRAYMRVIALLRAGNEAEARAAARQYIDDFPSGLRRAEVSAIAE